MPTISFSLEDLRDLVGKKVTFDEVENFVAYGKGEVKSYSKETDEVTVDFDDTNLPYLWSVEGVARLVKGILGLQKGFARLPIKKSDYSVIADESVNDVRPYVAALVAKGKRIDEYLLKQLIQLQEKLCDSYGKRRSKVAMGIYSYEKIAFPIHYRAVRPDAVKFAPLDFSQEMTLKEILEGHPKGKEYGFILKDCSRYPLLVDTKGSVLSFPPIINSAGTGKIAVGEERFFIEVTGTDSDALHLCLNIVAFALHERGFDIYGVAVHSGSKCITAPLLKEEKIKVAPEFTTRLFGLELGKHEMKALLERAGYGLNTNGTIIIPPYRGDILHPVDVVEDIGIMYGYDKMEVKPLASYTAGGTSPAVKFSNRLRELAVGLGFQEVLSPILTNKEILYGKMGMGDSGTIEIENFMSETYSCVRSWLIPILMEFLSKNKHVAYPQKVFELGKVAVKEGGVAVNEGGKAVDYEKIAFASAHEKADYTEARQVVDYVLAQLGLSGDIKKAEHGSFLPGRAGRVIVSGKEVGFLGEVHPQVLENHKIMVPVVALELNLDALFEFVEKEK